jgi:hypothetical protein
MPSPESSPPAAPDPIAVAISVVNGDFAPSSATF